ncbi:hypothetical protein DPMN_039730 [Dreissena polymorpha]|uniref:Uncharacterized protein n=1 Tax=Dreissena polymorpha TaxID=45954 RepID=A0A9D4CVC2_DREPO|nr:hypothetical protein DPMN_039730 [Dreissena polymorpha]
MAKPSPLAIDKSTAKTVPSRNRSIHGYNDPLTYPPDLQYKWHPLPHPPDPWRQ